MNKNKTLSLAAMITLALSGCNHDEIKPTTPDGGGVTPPTDVIPPTDIIPPTVYTATLKTSDILITGDVECNGDSLADGTFTVSQGQPVNCLFGSVDLGSFKAPFPDNVLVEHRAEQATTSFDVTNAKGANATRILKSISNIESDSEIKLALIDSYDIVDIFQQLDDDAAVEQFLTPKVEDSTDEIGNAPSSHVDPNVTPTVDKDATNDPNGSFVSASAEESLTYKPAHDVVIKTQAKLTDAYDTPLEGIAFFSNSSTGVTGSDGGFEYIWGDNITFGIDTFEFGSVRGNKFEFKLGDVTESEVAKANIQSLLERYMENNGSSLVVPDKVQQVFSLYPNVVNELINLNLPNGGYIDDTEFMLPDEFSKQFESGLTKDLDDAILATIARRYSYANQLPQTISTNSEGYVTESLKEIFNNVTTFHVFHDNGSFYGASGYARGMRALNINNRAFPLVSPRTDINKNQSFGEMQAWDRNGKPYIAVHPDIEMPDVPVISKDNAVYGLPFVTAGQIGSGNVVFMGNGMYPSILSCPDNYWVNGALRIDSDAQSCSIQGNVNANHDDNGSMATFFVNLFKWFNKGSSVAGLTVGTNITTAYASWVSTDMGRQYDFFVNPSFGFGAVQHIAQGGYSNLDPESMPILLLQTYPPKVIKDGMTRQFVSDLENPNLSQQDITDLIDYIHRGGSVLFMDGIQQQNPEPIARLADAAGVAVGGTNVAHTDQVNCGSSYYCQNVTPNLHARAEHDMIVIERFEDVAGVGQPYTVHDDGTVEWINDPTKIKFGIPQYQTQKKDAQGNPVVDNDGAPVMETKYAQIFVTSEAEKIAAIAELQAAFPQFSECTHDYQYEFNCIEYRSGDGITDRGNYGRADFDRYDISPDTLSALVKSSNLGDNVEALYQHEVYYRTKGTQGKRLSTSELNQTYDSLSIWMWNNNDYGYDGSHHHDELGFKKAVEFLNCYTNNQHGLGADCPSDLKSSLLTHDMLHDNGELNPSYPLNYMEKPLTRIMLGRSYWDPEIVVDTTSYPGRPTTTGRSASVTIETQGNAVSYSAGNRQATGLWAPQLEQVNVYGGVPATITVMLADDLTGLPNHEKSLNRPPRMTKSFDYDGSSLSFSVPYGGLIYVRPLEQRSEAVEFNFANVVKAPLWKNGEWVNDVDAGAPIGEIDTGSFIYTAPKNNLRDPNIDDFVEKMEIFAEATSDFYGRDEVTADGNHRRFTYPDLKGFRHHYVNDVQISIGAAHSGYPVMASGFKVNNTTIGTEPLNSWLLWHEFGHNVASAPFNAEGSTEVTNNLLALYMQEHPARKEQAEMVRIKLDIKKAPLWLSSNAGHAWSNADAGIRLVMFGQLKVWAKSNFDIDAWYDNAGIDKASIYGSDQGWNMFKLMHRLARDNSDAIGDKNFCSSKETGLSGGDLMMVCTSYASGYDLSEFFTQWNVGEKSTTTADGNIQYEGGISNKAHSVMSELRSALVLEPVTSENNPLAIDSVNWSK